FNAAAGGCVGDGRWLIPAHEVQDDALLDGTGVFLDPRHDPGREGQEADEDEDGGQGRHACEPEEQDDGLKATSWTAVGRLPLCSEFANALTASGVILPAGTR